LFGRNAVAGNDLYVAGCPPSYTKALCDNAKSLSKG